MSCRLVSAKPESCISIQVSGEERSSGGELLADQPQPDQPCSHCEFRIFCLLWFRTCCFQLFCHFGKYKAKLNVTFQLPCVKSVSLAISRFVELEQPKFNCFFRKNGMVVGHMIAAVIVMLISAVIRTVCPVPDVGKLSHGGRFFLIQLFNEIRVDGSAVATHTVLVKVQGIRKQPLVACHDVRPCLKNKTCIKNRKMIK